MAFDGIVTKKVISELESVLIGGKINKVFEPNKNEIILGIYSNGKNYALDISIASNNYRINLTTTSKPNPFNAPNFCMLLRKYLVGMKIKKIYNYSLERIIYIDLEGYNELNDLVSKTLVIELMGKHSNIILLNDKKIIIDSLRHLDSFSGSSRDILPAHEYTMPPVEKEDFYKTSKEDFRFEGFLTTSIPDKYNGISKAFIHNTLNKLGISDSNYSNNDLNKIYDYIKEILDNIDSNNISMINFDKKDFVISLAKTDEQLQANFFLDDFYKQKEDNEVLVNYRSNLSKLVLSALKKITKKVNNINSKLKECEEMDTFRIYGELITSNLYRIDNSKNVQSITLENYYDNNKPITIPLDKTISPSYNAKKFFKKYNKLKNTLSIVSEQKKEATKELYYLESIIYELENATTISELEEIDAEISENVLFKNTSKNANVKKNKISKRNINDEYEPITYNVDGFTLYVGKNNKQNDYITTKLGKNEDIWFHTKDIRGSHCLLKCNGSKVNDNTIVACAQIAAYYSKAKLSSNVPVDYCYIKNVKKPSGAKPGMVIFTNNQTINVNPKKD
ncbi:MAG: NFACT family protein [Clostridia bacterium]|nr:NFACT family protein [Clostridia bacterium]